jgi:hypothetical protein
MKVRVGPIAKESARAWVDYALQIVQHLDNDALAYRFPAEVATDSAVLLLEWSAQLDDGSPDFVWDGDLEPRATRLLLRYWFNLARQFLAKARVGELEPVGPDGEEFADVLLRATLDALVAVREIEPDDATRMWKMWPRLNAPRPSAVTD